MNPMMMTQGSAEWLQARLGMCTASRVIDAIAVRKDGKESATRFTYAIELVSERLTNNAADHYVSEAMARGNEQEKFSRAAYEIANSVDVDQVGFIVHPRIPMAGCSPDGLICGNGGLEIKNPRTETHIRYLIANQLPKDYEPQVMFALACTGREWWDFVSFDGRLPSRYEMVQITVFRDEQRIAAMEQAVQDFLGYVDSIMARIDGATCENFTEVLSRSVEIGKEEGITDADKPEWMKQLER